MSHAMDTMNQNCTGKLWRNVRELNRATGIVNGRLQEEIDQVLDYLNSK
jgi:hypothetical protein